MTEIEMFKKVFLNPITCHVFLESLQKDHGVKFNKELSELTHEEKVTIAWKVVEAAIKKEVKS